jgi:hypothetical protein
MGLLQLTLLLMSWANVLKYKLTQHTSWDGGTLNPQGHYSLSLLLLLLLLSLPATHDTTTVSGHRSSEWRLLL